MLLRSYLSSFHLAVSTFEDYGYIESVEIQEEIRTNKQLVLHAEIVFINGSYLQIKEFIEAKYKLQRFSYAYHYQDGNGNCIFRYDNAAHKPKLGFTEHKHVGEKKIVQAELPSLQNIFDEIVGYL